MSLQIHPGTIALTCTLWGASSIAIDLVSWTRPPWAAAYDGTAIEPKREYSLAILIILPRFRERIDCAASCESRNTELRLVSSTRSQDSGSSLSAPLTTEIPA